MAQNDTMPQFTAKPVPPPFASDSACLAGIRSGEVRRAKRDRLLNANGAVPANNPANATHQDPNALVRSRLALLDEEIARTRECLRKNMRPQHRAALQRSLDALLDPERRFMRITDPGTEKPEPRTPIRSQGCNVIIGTTTDTGDLHRTQD